MVGEQLAAPIGLSVGAAIGVAAGVAAARRRSLPFPPLLAMFAVLFAAMAVVGLIESDSTASFIGMLALFFMYSPIWRTGSTALRVIYSLLLIAVSTLFIAVSGIEAVPRLTGIMALIGIAVGVASMVMLAKR